MTRSAPWTSAVAVLMAFALNACGDGGGGGGPPPTPPPNPLYVSTRGNDANSGAGPQDALRTISRAAEVARDEYKIIVAAGVYNEGVTTAEMGEAPQRLSFLADGDVLIDGRGTGAPAGFSLFRSVGSLIAGLTPQDGFSITGFPDAGIVIKSDSDDFTIQNCTVFDNDGDGIRVQDSKRVLVFNNLVYGNGGAGVAIVGTLTGSPNARVLSNTLVDNRNRGITIGNSRRASQGAEVQNNIVQNNGGDANIKVFADPPSTTGYVGNYNLVFPGTYIPSTIDGRRDVNGDARFVSGDGASAEGYCLLTTSPAINKGTALNLPDPQSNILRARSTNCRTLDTGVLDIGFHFPR